MADDDQFSLKSGYETEPAVADPPEPPKEPDKQSEQKQPDDQSKEDPDPDQPVTNKEIREHLNQLHEDSNRGEKMQKQLEAEVENLKKIASQPMAGPPTSVTPPPPLSEQQKGGLAQWTMNLLKFGALAAIAYGIGNRRGGGIYKAAIAGALNGYAQGRKDVVDQSMKLWEQHNKVVEETNREQNANYRAILADRRLSLTQQLDLISARAKLNGDQNTLHAAENKDTIALQKNLDQQEKVEKDKREFEIKHRHMIYDVIGKKNINGQYFAWVRAKTGINVDANWTADQFYDFEKQHPEAAFTEFMDWQHDQDLQRLKKQEEIKDQTRKDIKAKPSTQAEKEKAANPLELNLPPVK